MSNRREPPDGRYHPIRYVFLAAGPFVVIPYLVLMPVIVTLRSAWNKRPRALWRMATVVSTSVALMVTCPPSPFFIGLDRPIDPSMFYDRSSYMMSLWNLLGWQCVLVNAALIASVVLFPVSAASTVATIVSRRRGAKTMPT